MRLVHGETRPVHRAGRPRPRARGVPAAAAGRRAVPRGGGGAGRRRGDLRGAGDAGRRTSRDRARCPAARPRSLRRGRRTAPGRGRDVAARDVSFAVEPGETVALDRPVRRGQVDAAERRCSASRRRPRAGCGVGGADLAELDLAELARADRLGAAAARTSSRARSPTTYGWPGPTPPTTAVRAALRDAGAPVRGRAARRARTRARRGRRRALGRAAATGRPGPRVPRRPAAAAARRADGGAGRGDGGRRRRRGPAAWRAGRTVLLVVHRPALLARGGPGGARSEPRAGRRGRRHRTSGATAAAVRAGPGHGSRAGRGRSWTEPAHAQSAAPGGRRSPPRRACGRPPARRRGRLALALLLGASRSASAVGLMATSGWLISRASEQPPVLYLMVAVTATRAFGIGRAVFRYAERLVSHDAVLRMLAETARRRLPAAGTARPRRAAPAPAAGTCSPGSSPTSTPSRTTCCAGCCPRRGRGRRGRAVRRLHRRGCCPRPGRCSPLGLLAAGVGVPAAHRRARPPCRTPTRPRARRPGHPRRRPAHRHRRTDRRRRAARPARQGTARPTGELTRIAARAAAATALGGGLSALVCGLTVTCAAWSGSRRCATGGSTGSGWRSSCSRRSPRSRRSPDCRSPSSTGSGSSASAERVYEVLDAPVPVTNRSSPPPPPGDAVPARACEGLGARHAGAGAGRARRLRPDADRRAPDRGRRRVGLRQDHPRPGAAPLPGRRRGDVHARRRGRGRAGRGRRSAASSGCAPRTPTSSTAPCGRTSGSRVRGDGGRAAAGAARRPAARLGRRAARRSRHPRRRARRPALRRPAPA